MPQPSNDSNHKPTYAYEYDATYSEYYDGDNYAYDYYSDANPAVHEMCYWKSSSYDNNDYGDHNALHWKVLTNETESDVRLELIEGMLVCKYRP